MKIWLFKNSKINKSLIIKNENILDYLSFIDSDFDISELEKKESLNGKNIKALTFEETFISSELSGELDKKNLNEYDFAIVKNYSLFTNNEFSFWNIEKIIFESITTFNIQFKINILISISTNDLIGNNYVNILKSHLSEQDNFEDLENLILQNNHFFQKPQPIGESIDIVNIKYVDELLAKEEKAIWEEFKVTKWAVAIRIEQSDRVETQFVPKLGNFDNEKDYITEPRSVFIFPLGEEVPVSIQLEPAGTFLKKIIKGNILYEELAKDSNTISIIMLDFLPNFGATIYTDPETQEKSIGFRFDARYEWGMIENDDVIKVTRINKQATHQKFYAENPNKFFNWIPATEIFDGTIETDEWIIGNEIILNFFPFKEFEISIWGESTGSGWNFTNNQKRDLLLNEDKELFRRTFSPTPQAFDLIDELREFSINFDGSEETDYYMFGERSHKIKRGLFLPLTTDKFQEYLNNKVAAGVQDYLLPLSGGALGGKLLTGGAFGAVLGAGIGTAKTALNRASLKKLPDSIKDAGTNLISEAILNFDTRTLIIKQIDSRDRRLVGKEFHKYGYYRFHNSINFQNLFSKLRFNFIQVSQTETMERIFINSKIKDKDLLKEAFELLVSGVHYWNFDNDWSEILKNYIFNYNIKNPTIIDPPETNE